MLVIVQLPIVVVVHSSDQLIIITLYTQIIGACMHYDYKYGSYVAS